MWIQLPRVEVFLRWYGLAALTFMCGVAIWAIVQINRLKQEQVIALGILDTLAARAGLKQAVDAIQAGRRIDDSAPLPIDVPSLVGKDPPR